jgi:hypothetical protein
MEKSTEIGALSVHEHASLCFSFLPRTQQRHRVAKIRLGVGCPGCSDGLGTEHPEQIEQDAREAMETRGTGGHSTDSMPSVSRYIDVRMGDSESLPMVSSIQIIYPPTGYTLVYNVSRDPTPSIGPSQVQCPLVTDPN